MDTKFRSRKYQLAIFFSIVSTVALFTGFLDGGAFIAAIGLILGLYGGANVLEKSTENVS